MRDEILNWLLRKSALFLNCAHAGWNFKLLAKEVCPFCNCNAIYIIAHLPYASTAISTPRRLQRVILINSERKKGKQYSFEHFKTEQLRSTSSNSSV